MAGFTNEDVYWNQQQADPSRLSPNPYYDNEQEYNNLQAQQLDFQSFNDTNNDASNQSKLFYNANQSKQAYMEPYPHMFAPMATDFTDGNNVSSEFDEPPLLEELEIYPERIMEKTLAVLNPFRSHGLADDAEFLAKQTDLAGPLAFCCLLAICLFLAGNKAPFGYIYGLSVVSCLMMYILLTLMTSSLGVFTLSNVASILGYCLLPIVALAIMGVFVSLHSGFGILLSVSAVLWSSLSASRLFVAMSGDHEQRPLIAYPCALVCGVFALLVVF